jgi:copper transport protein
MDDQLEALSTPARRPHRRRHARRFATLVVLAFALITLVPAPHAGAHAAFVSSTPADGERLETSPADVTFAFNEEVTVGLGGITVLNSNGDRVDEGVTTRPAPNQVRVNLRPDLPDGTYLAGYRVVSADGHIVTGATVFAVGEQADRAAVEGLEADRNPVTAVVGVVSGVLLYTGVLTALGLALFVLFVAGRNLDVRRHVTIARAAVIIGAIGAFGHVATRAGDGTGGSPATVFESGVLGEVLRQANTGWWLAGVLVGLAITYVSVGLRPGPVRQALVVYGTLVTAGSFALTGHTASSEPMLVFGLADVVHLLVGAVWLGGLVGTALVLGPPAHSDATTPGSPAQAGVEVVTRFSTVAAVSVALLWVTGVIQAWWTVGEFSALFDSDYGRILVAKLVVVVATLVIAGWNRRKLVPRLGGDETDDTMTKLRKTVRVEVILLVVAILITSVLVETAPPSIAAAGPQPFNQTVPVTDGVDVNLYVTPGAPGLNEVHVLYIDDAGMLTDRVESVTVEMTLDAAGIGPIIIGGAAIGPGHYLLRTENLAVAGLWRIEVVSRIGTFEQRRTTFNVPINN